jgi:hypothetical protein
MLVFVFVPVLWHALPGSSDSVIMNRQIDVGAFKAFSFMDVVSGKRALGSVARIWGVEGEAVG